MGARVEEVKHIIIHRRSIGSGELGSGRSTQWVKDISWNGTLYDWGTLDSIYRSEQATSFNKTREAQVRVSKFRVARS